MRIIRKKILPNSHRLKFKNRTLLKMSVKRKILEAKTDKELEIYLQEDTRFVPPAIQFAYEILKSRGRIFTPEEIEQITFLIEEKSRNDKITIHPNHKKAANLIYASAALSIVNIIISPYVNFSFLNIFFSLIIVGMIFGIGYIVSKGSNGVKYIILAMMIIGLMYIPLMMSNIIQNPVVGTINIMQTALQIWALILLFQIPKPIK